MFQRGANIQQMSSINFRQTLPQHRNQRSPHHKNPHHQPQDPVDPQNRKCRKDNFPLNHKMNS